MIIVHGGVEGVHLHFKSGVHSQMWSEMIDILEELWRNDTDQVFLYQRVWGGTTNCFDMIGQIEQ